MCGQTYKTILKVNVFHWCLYPIDYNDLIESKTKIVLTEAIKMFWSYN